MVFIIPILGLLGNVVGGALTGLGGVAGGALAGLGNLASGVGKGFGALFGKKPEGNDNPLMSLLWQPSGQQQQQHQQQQQQLMQELLNQQKSMLPDSMRHRGFWEGFPGPVI